MPALITVNWGYGHRPHVCDARCYNAIGPDCNCVCGGENHRQGYDIAFENTQKHAISMVADLITNLGLEETPIKVKIFDGKKLKRSFMV